MSIALNHITLSYGSRTLLEDVTAAFAQGSLTALIGRNGTGKSTLLRAIAGLGTTVSGDVALCGRPLASLTPHELSTTVGFVTTDKVRIANLACEDVVALGRAPYTNWIGRMQEADRAVVERSLRLVGMLSLIHISEPTRLRRISAWWGCRPSPARPWTACPTASASG